MTRIIADIENTSEFAQLKTEVLSKRSAGEVLLEIKELKPHQPINSTDELIETIDLFVSKLGCSQLGNSWKEINQAAAKNIVILIMTEDLAYSAKLMNTEAAEQIFAKFLNFFSGDRKLFTNASFVNNYSGLSNWNSLTEATFDTGIVVINDQRIGILWVKDED